jgi:hypothetical protein
MPILLGNLVETVRRGLVLLLEGCVSGRLGRIGGLILEALVQELPKRQLLDFGEGVYGGELSSIRSILWSWGRRGRRVVPLVY